MSYKQCLKELSDNPVNITSLSSIKIDSVDELSYIVYFIFINVKMGRLSINNDDDVYNFIYKVIKYLEDSKKSDDNMWFNTNIYYLYYMCFNMGLIFKDLKYNLKLTEEELREETITQYGTNLIKKISEYLKLGIYVYSIDEKNVDCSNIDNIVTHKTETLPDSRYLSNISIKSLLDLESKLQDNKDFILILFNDVEYKYMFFKYFNIKSYYISVSKFNGSKSINKYELRLNNQLLNITIEEVLKINIKLNYNNKIYIKNIIKLGELSIMSKYNKQEKELGLFKQILYNEKTYNITYSIVHNGGGGVNNCLFISILDGIFDKKIPIKHKYILDTPTKMRVSSYRACIQLIRKDCLEYVE